MEDDIKYQLGLTSDQRVDLQDMLMHNQSNISRPLFNLLDDLINDDLIELDQ